MTILRIVSSEIMKHNVSVIEQINHYARNNGFVKKEGAFFTKEGGYIGGLYDIGRMAGIDMQEFK